MHSHSCCVLDPIQGRAETCPCNFYLVCLGGDVWRTCIQLPYHSLMHTSHGFQTHRLNARAIGVDTAEFKGLGGGGLDTGIPDEESYTSSYWFPIVSYADEFCIINNGYVFTSSLNVHCIQNEKAHRFISDQTIFSNSLAFSCTWCPLPITFYYVVKDRWGTRYVLKDLHLNLKL